MGVEEGSRREEARWRGKGESGSRHLVNAA